MFAGVKLPRPLTRLPVRFCAETLAAEAGALPADAWVPHPQKFEGNEYVPLVSPSGQITNEFAGPMAITPYLERCRYMMEVMSALDCVWGRSRLMGLGPGQGVPEHIDINYYWRTHVRVHVPIITNPDVLFTCGGETVTMAPGECWVVDTFQSHEVHNRGSEQRIHLVLDTVGGERLWDAIEAAQDGSQDSPLVAPGTAAATALRIEQSNYPTIMSPWEMRTHFEFVLGQAQDAPQLELIRKRLDRLVAGWTATWAELSDDPSAAPVYRSLIASAQADLNAIGGHAIMLVNNRSLYRVLQGFIFENAVESERVRASKAAALAGAQRLAS